MQPDNICNCVADIAVELPFGFLHTGDDNHDIIASIREYIPRLHVGRPGYRPLVPVALLSSVACSWRECAVRGS